MSSLVSERLIAFRVVLFNEVAIVFSAVVVILTLRLTPVC